MNNLEIANIIKIIHILFIIFIIITPFTNNQILLYYHYIIVPFIIIRWIFNYDKCNITEIEAQLRGINQHDGFIYNLLKPIYTPPQKHVIIITYIITLLLWLKTLRKLL
tara:strand:+ start:176 stop:502 length:327 start_codon:yes stop_codon:yes gene_type:complete